MNDGTDKLCQALYGRPAEAKDYLGGSNAKMLYDAAATINETVDALKCLRFHSLDAQKLATDALNTCKTIGVKGI